MVEVSRMSLGIAGLAGSLLLAYAVYFDRKRRSDPDFKKKLRESECDELDDAKRSSSLFRLILYLKRFYRTWEIQEDQLFQEQ